MDENHYILEEILHGILDQKGSDVYIIPGAPVTLKVNNQLKPLFVNKLLLSECDDLIHQIYERASHRSTQRLLENGDDDFSFGLKDLGRFRCNAFKQRGSLAAVLRVVPFTLPDPKVLHIPESVLSLSQKKRGMVLVTGPAGSGKTTTLACLIDQININRSGHIITLEDPIEYIHPHKHCLVTQREIENDTLDFAHALRASLREAPDVILLGEMRDYETMQTALTAAETGHLLFSTLHTSGSGKTIDRIVDVFPAAQQQQVRIQLSMVLQAVVSQQLIPTLDGGIEPVFEVMMVNSAISNMIRENKIAQIDNVIYASSTEGMISMDGDILRLYKAKRISRENALLYAINPDTLAKRL